VTTGQGRVCETGERRKREGGMVPRSFSSPPLINLVQFLLLRENPGLNNLERKEPHASYRGSRLFERMNYCARFSPYSHKETCQNVCRICVKKGCSKWDSMLPGLLFKRSSDPFTNPATSPANNHKLQDTATHSGCNTLQRPVTGGFLREPCD